MELKNAAAVCLISLFAATLVVLVARSLDSQSAARLEPQLARIVDELEAIRKQGRVPVAARGAADEETLAVYYFHSANRCATCEAIEAQTRDTLKTDFAVEMKAQKIVLKVLNYETPSGAPLATRFKVAGSVVVLARLRGGEVQESRKLSRCLALADDKPALGDYLRSEIRAMLDRRAESRPDAAAETPAIAPSIPAPQGLPLPVPAAAPSSEK